MNFFASPIIGIQHCVKGVQCVDAFIFCKMMTTIALATMSIISQNHHCFFAVRTFNIYHFTNLQVYTTIQLTLLTARPINNLQL